MSVDDGFNRIEKKLFLIKKTQKVEKYKKNGNNIKIL
jgi:hypothetical protein